MAIIRPCIDPALCCGDGLCVAVCPTGSIVMDSGKAVLNPGLSRPCNGCGHCAAVCPRRAVSVEREGQGDTPADDAAWSAWRLEPARLNAFLRMRRSVREFKPDPVPREVLEGVLDAARYAPTASNRQDLGWIVVQDRAALRRLADSIAAWAEGSPLYAAVAEEYRRGVDTMLRDAPCALLVHSRRDFAMSGQDCGVALTYVALLLAAEGLGACWSGLAGRAALERPDLLAWLGLPDDRAVYGGLMVGYPRYRYRRPPARLAARVEWL